MQVRFPTSATTVAARRPRATITACARPNRTSVRLGAPTMLDAASIDRDNDATPPRPSESRLDACVADYPPGPRCVPTGPWLESETPAPGSSSARHYVALMQAAGPALEPAAPLRPGRNRGRHGPSRPAGRRPRWRVALPGPTAAPLSANAPVTPEKRYGATGCVRDGGRGCWGLQSSAVFPRAHNVPARDVKIPTTAAPTSRPQTVSAAASRRVPELRCHAVIAATPFRPGRLDDGQSTILHPVRDDAGDRHSVRTGQQPPIHLFPD